MIYRIFKLLALLTFSSGTIAAEAEAWDAWKQPGVHAIMRHATAPGFGDPEGFTLSQCDTQRNLNDAGRNEARKLGEAIRKNGIKLSAIYASQWCRTLHTAEEMRLGKVQALPTLNSFFQGRGNNDAQTTALKKHIATLKPDDKVLYVTHQVNTTALTDIFPSSGEVILFRMTPNGEIEVRGRISAAP